MVRRTVLVIAMVTSFVCGTLVVTTLPAEAATATVTLKFGNWNCTKGGTIAALQVSIDQGGETNWTTGTAWTSGRYVKLWSVLNTRVWVNANLLCNRPWYKGGSYYTPVILVPRYFDASKLVTTI